MNARKRRFQVTNSRIITVLVLLGPLGAIPQTAVPPGSRVPEQSGLGAPPWPPAGQPTGNPREAEEKIHN